MRRPIVVLLVLVLAACQAGKKTVPTDQAGIAIVVEHGLGGADAAVRDLVRAVPKGSTPVRIVYGAGTRVPELHGALRAAIDELAKIGTKRQVLVVVGSGHEPDDTAYRAQAARARRQARGLHAARAARSLPRQRRPDARARHRRQRRAR